MFRHCRSFVIIAAIFAVASAQPSFFCVEAASLAGLREETRVVRDFQGIPHIYARNDLDASFMIGYVHAQDRLFQMDSLRRLFSGQLAELLGPGALPTDVQLRTLGLRRAAEETWATSSRQTAVWLQAYADGVNAYLETRPLPPQYGALELTRSSIPKWTPVDSLVAGKGLAFGLSFDLDDIERTIALVAYQTAGGAAGFDGTALFFEDLFRSAPMDPTVSIPTTPGGGDPQAIEAASSLLATARRVQKVIRPEALELARSYRDRIAQIPSLAWTLNSSDVDRGSNWWLVGGDNSASGLPMLANDPHLALDSPSTFYEVHILVFDPDRHRVLNANGVSFPGAPALAQGCNSSICWGSTVNPMDVTDVYQEILVVDPTTGLPTHTIYKGEAEPLVVIPQVYRTNQVGDGVADNLATANIGPADGGLTFVVPRRNNGPIVAIDASAAPTVTALSVQYTGWRSTRELECFRRWWRATNIREFAEALQDFDVGSQNWGVADVAGNIAYFTSAEMPIREDLQNLNQPDGTPPYLIRDGSGTFANEWLPVSQPQPHQALDFEILPFSEMPQSVNPESGYILNANNDPVGTTLDNNPLNQLRPGGGLYYLSPGYSSLRAGRIRRLIEDALTDGGKISMDDMKRFQGNNQLLDAELVVPFITQAFDNSAAAGAPGSLSAFAGDPEIAEAVNRLRGWDYATPTGLAQGYDPGDDPSNLLEPDAAEIASSVAATIYSTWRGRMLANSVDAFLAAVGLGDFAPGSVQSWSAVVHLLQAFDQNEGVGASGARLLALAPDSADPAAGRDLTILQSLRDTLDLLASDTFAPAYGGSTDQDDYRWGYLHRIVFDSPLGGPFSIPEGGGFSSLSPDLPGIPRSGGFQVVDASSHSTRASTVNGFMFGSGPNRRFVGQIDHRTTEAFQVIPGGQSAFPGSPFQADQLHLWLTNSYHPMLLRSEAVRANRLTAQTFTPAD